MPKVKPYEKRIPAFYRRSALDLILFAHITAICKHTDLTIKDGIDDFFDTYGIDHEDYPFESALTIYNNVRNNFIWADIRKKLDNKEN